MNGLVAIVTGGASGMGQATASALSKRGARVVIWDKHIDQVAFDAIECDVSMAHDVEQAMQKTMDRVGVPRIGINCAGIAPARRMVNKQGPMPLAEFKRVIDINLIGTFNVMRVVAAAMMTLPILPNTEERGVIINTASVAAFEGQVGQSAYAASKGGVVAMTLPLARELAGQCIRVNAIAPGFMATPMLRSMPLEVQDNLQSTTLFPKRFGKPEEFAQLVLHILDNPLLNGTVIRLDGGVRMP